MAKKKAKDEGEAQEPVEKSGTGEAAEERTCFIIMPFSDPDGYSAGHFKEVEEHLLRPAIELAEFEPDVLTGDKATGMIHLELIRQLHDAEMVLADMSAQNANVAFELGFRQAFDKPVAMVKDSATGWLFDTASLHHHEYDVSLRPRRLAKDVEAIAKKIRMTWEQSQNGGTGNSLVNLLSLTSAQVREFQGSPEDAFRLKVMSRLDQISSQLPRFDSGRDGGRDGNVDTHSLSDNLPMIVESFAAAATLADSKSNLRKLRQAAPILELAVQQTEGLTAVSKSMLSKRLRACLQTINRRLLEFGDEVESEFPASDGT